MTNGIPHPFEIFWDVETASYSIFTPDGCILVNGVAATNDNVVNGNLALDFGDAPPQKVYCHVSKDGDAWKFTIDGEEEEEGAKYNVLVATFGKEENDGQSYDVVCSAISLGGESEADEVSIESSRESEDESGEPTVVEELAIKGWHTDESGTGDESVVGAIGLPVQESEFGKDILTRDGVGGGTGYKDLGLVDKSKLLSEISVDETSRGTSVSVTRLDGTEENFIIPPAVTPRDFDAEATAETLEPTADATAAVTLANGTFSFEFGIPKGEQGEPGEDGDDGKDGEDGKSPSVSLADVSGDTSHPNGGVKVSVTNADGTQGDEKTVWNGNDGEDGDPGADGLSITAVSAEAGSPVEADGYTKTPITFTFTMSDGSTITSNAVDILAKNGSDYEPEAEEVDFVGDVKYDVSDHQLKKIVSTFYPKTGVVESGTWEMITGGQAVPHSGEEAQ